MTGAMSYADALGRLRQAMVEAPKNRLYQEIVNARDAVLARFSPVFSPEHIPQLEEAEVAAFLRDENNKHWTGLYRRGSSICANMDLLRQALGALLDETRPLAQRFDEAIRSVQGLGKAIASAILLVAYPDKYGVWNNVSEAALRRLGIWPDFKRGESLGQRYEQINTLLVRLSNDLGIDLWTLDALLWYYEATSQKSPGSESETASEVQPGEGLGFSLERHLQEFLRDNWDRTELGRDWAVYEEPDDPERGYEYPTDVGRIDILARHRSKPEWLVIELKRNQTADATVGQVLRYMGWVRQHLAKPGDSVRGLIIARQVDHGLLYALSAVPNIDLRRYEVTFSLHPVAKPPESPGVAPAVGLSGGPPA